MYNLPPKFIKQLERLRLKETRAKNIEEMIQAALVFYDKQAPRYENELFDDAPKGSVIPHPCMNPFARDYAHPDDPNCAMVLDREGKIVDFKGECPFGLRPAMDLIGYHIWQACPMYSPFRMDHFMHSFESEKFHEWSFDVSVQKAKLAVQHKWFPVDENHVVGLFWWQPANDGQSAHEFFTLWGQKIELPYVESQSTTSV